MRIFNVCEKSLRSIPGIEHIHPLKQRDVAKLLKRIRPIKIFGSSIRMDCNRTSDIDFLLDANKIGLTKSEIHHIIRDTISCPYDVLWEDEIVGNLSAMQERNIVKGAVELC